MNVCHDDYQDERLTNLLAAKAALSYFQGKQVPLNYSSALFETDYNAACYYIGSGDYKKALSHLENAESKTFCAFILKFSQNYVERHLRMIQMLRRNKLMKS